MIHRVESIRLLHQIAGLEAPRNPLVSVIDFSKVDLGGMPTAQSFACGFHSINFKSDCRLQYGRQPFDHQDGTLLCTGPGQVLTYTPAEPGSEPSSGWGLFFHPEFIVNSELASLLRQCTFFLYAENEALHLNADEHLTFHALVRNIDKECRSVDPYAPEIIEANLVLLLRYCRRAYGAQIASRTRHDDLLTRFERHLQEFIESPGRPESLPSVRQCAEAMHLSTNYFSDLIRLETGRSPQEHIHHLLVERAKILLATSPKSISEIAYSLGFEYPQSLSKLFKKKTGLSPVAYRDRFRGKAATGPLIAH
ncbi:MAG: hypothetical protein RL318_575 [Fibrobacterota bacterium]|jgi:AraC-like DNA-binding protein